MSTSPSWFDQDKFARLKKVGPKVVLKPLSTTVPVPETAASQPPAEKESQFLPEQKASQPLPEKKESQPLPEPPASAPAPEIKASQPLPEASVPTEPAAAESEPTPGEEEAPEAGISPVPPVNASQRMMTSQSVSLKNLRAEIPPVAPPTPAPIRAPVEISPSGLKAPTLPIDSKVLLRRTSSLPALKSITEPDSHPVVLDPAASLPVRAPASSASCNRRKIWRPHGKRSPS